MFTSAPQAVIFDLDGTLVDSLKDLANATNTALALAGYPTHPVHAYRYFVGNGVEVLMQRALPAGEAEATQQTDVFQKLLATFRAEYDSHWHACSHPYPGIADMLNALAERGVPMAVLSNKPHDWTQVFIRHFFPDVPFVEIRGAKPGVPHKPNPTSALDVAQLLGFAPANIAFMGDSKVDIGTAVNAGMYPVGVTWGFRDREELLQAGAKTIIDAPEQFLGLLV